MTNTTLNPLELLLAAPRNTNKPARQPVATRKPAARHAVRNIGTPADTRRHVSNAELNASAGAWVAANSTDAACDYYASLEG